MPAPHTVLLFMLAALALNVTPGPSIFFILSRCLGQGRSAAIASVFGLAMGAVICAVAAAFGLSALFVYSPLAFAIVKYCGAAYLIYLGARGVMTGGIAGMAAKLDTTRAVPLAVLFWQGVLADLLNPKILLFFFSFLPQFVDPARGSAQSQMLFLGLLFQVTALPTNLAVAIAGGSLTRFIGRRPFWARVQSWLSGAVLIGLGVRLAFTERR